MQVILSVVFVNYVLRNVYNEMHIYDIYEREWELINVLLFYNTCYLYISSYDIMNYNVRNLDTIYPFVIIKMIIFK